MMGMNKWDGKSYTGVEVETPVVGVGKDNVANTETDKLDLKEINLDEEVRLLVEGKKYGYMNHPFDDKKSYIFGFKTDNYIMD